ncbi:hypothetical protein [Methylorubrum extorquens]|uniref:hypothetical protein n=1 Tax=Methylorubrum extorquens TaxID=408 RepID=UPI001EE61BD1|nr:hypothetical protein [Methylorubrum extorquens]MCG5247835.1 hypothetical protein [Methylorubrum extorquens]
MKSVARALFDCDWYRGQSPRRLFPWTDPLKHYIRNGTHQKLDPNAYFSTAWYLENYKAVGDAGVNPLVHYMTQGFVEGCDPSERFSTRWYLFNNADVRRSCINPLEHFIRHGKAEGRSPTQPNGLKLFRDRKLDTPESLFDDEWYGRKHPETAHLSADHRYKHYVQVGASLGYDPNPLLCSRWYIDSLTSGLQDHPNALSHYFHVGAPAGLDPGPLFNTNWYLEMNPDVGRFGYNPLAHFLLYGQNGSACPHPMFFNEDNASLSCAHPSNVYAAVSNQFDVTDITSLIKNCVSFPDLLSGRVLQAFFDLDFCTHVIAPISPAGSARDDLAVHENVTLIAGFDGFVSGGAASVFSLNVPLYSGGLGTAIIMKVRYHVAPALAAAIALFTNSELPDETRAETILSRLGRLSSCLEDTVILVEDDLPEHVYRSILREGGPNRQLIRLAVGTMCHVRHLDVSLQM